MIDGIIADMGSCFRKGVFAKKTSFLFFVDDTAITVIMDRDSFAVEKGMAVEKADCSCKTGAEMFRKIWCDGYRPGIMDFLSRTIECDEPLMLPQFLKGFGK